MEELLEKYIDESNPQHFINLVPPRVKEAILKIPPAYFSFSEKKLLSQTYTDGIPEDSDYELRLSFFEEYESCFKTFKKMSVQKICEGVIRPEQFYQNILPNPGRLTFVITEPARVQNRLKYGFHLTLQEMIKIVKEPTRTNPKTGMPDPKQMEVKLKIFEYLDQRLHGSLIQRQQIESKSINVNVDAGPRALENLHTPEAIDARLRELETELLSPSQAQIPTPQEILTPMERVHLEAGRVIDAEYKIERKER